MKKVRPSEDALGQLKVAGKYIARATDALLAMDLSIADCPAHLQSADAILKDLKEGAVLADRNRFEPLLRDIAAQSARVAKLLQSAANLRFGGILCHQVSNVCYTRDGSSEGNFGGRSLLIEG